MNGYNDVCVSGVNGLTPTGDGNKITIIINNIFTLC